MLRAVLGGGQYSPGRTSEKAGPKAAGGGRRKPPCQGSVASH